MTRDPVRWLEHDDDAELARLMRAGDEAPPSEVLARVERELTAVARAAPPREGQSSAPQAALSGATARAARGKIAALAVAALAVAFVAYRVLHAPEPSPTQSREPAGSSSTPALPDPQPTPSEPAPDLVRPVQADVDAAIASPRAAAPPARARNRAKRVEPEADSSSTRLEEARMLERARGELAARPERALELLRAHERRFPEGWLQEERLALTVRALVRAGRIDLARTRLVELKRRYPSSAHLLGLEREVQMP